MKKYLLFTISFLITGTVSIYSQKPVKSFKANYYKDYTYPGSISPGIPDVTPIVIEGVPGAWNGLPPEHTKNWPNNSLTPIEITTSLGTISLNGEDADGTKHNFKGMKIELPEYSNTNRGHYYYLRGAVEGYGGGLDHFNHTNQSDYEWYLTSGIEHMDLATGIANIPSEARLTFGIILTGKDRINDGKPDIIFSQITGPSGSFDKLHFLDKDNKIVGNEVEVSFIQNSIPYLGADRYWDFHKGAGPTSVGDGNKGLKMVAFELSDFGINSSNYDQIKKLQYNPSGDSDVAFIAADRLSLIAFKKLDANVSGKPTACQGETEYVIFEVASEDGKGPYRFTYDVITNEDTTTATVTGKTNSLGNYSKAQVAINTNNLGQVVTYKLKKVEDLGKNESKEYKNQAHTVTIKDCSEDYFVTTWKTTQNSETITIPTFTGGAVKYDYVIQWEGIDNANSAHSGKEIDITGNITLEFPTAGRYRVKIRGIFPYIYFNNSGDKDKILTVEQWGTIKWYSQENSYFGCKYLQISATDTPNFSEVTSLKNMFKEAYTINSPNISTWNTPKAENMEGMFDDARSFNQNLASWDMSTVTNVNNMFRNSNMSANKLGLTLSGWKDGTNDLTNLASPQQTLGSNLRYCNGETALTITNLTMPKKQCATPEKKVGEIYLETTNTGNNKRLAGIMANRAFEWLEEDVKVENLTANTEPTHKGKFKLAEGDGKFDFNGIQLDINKQVYSKNNVLRGFNSLTDEAIFPLANMTFTYKKEGSEDGFYFTGVLDSLPNRILEKEGIIVYSNGHFYESIKVDPNNRPDPSGTLKWVQIDN